MNFDISHLLEEWDYQPGQVAVRKFKTKDGTEKIQLRVDLGLLQMNAVGRPDGKRPFGRESLFEHFQARLEKRRRANPGTSDEFVLKAEDCAKLQQEAIQYHHRYICLFQLEELRMTGFGVGQCPIPVAAVPGGDDGAVTARHLEQT